ncbi:MAG: hypothetical protein AMXMBFR84_14520 [Candidatus Hydrogenedentota bacterium]
MRFKGFLVTAIAACAALGVAQPAAHAALQVGASSVNVTPDPLIPVSGGMGIPRKTEKQQGNLEVRTIVIDKDGERVAFVSVPFIGYPRVLGDKVRALVKDIPGDHILIGSTHTHSAPDMYAFPLPDGGHTGELAYMEKVVTQVAEGINAAVKALQPASIKIASGDAAEKIAYNYYAPQLYDRRCHVIQAVGKDGKAIATVVNYAIHPEVIGPGQGICSPDMVGPLYDRVAELGGGTCVFMNGAQGGMVTADCRGEDGEDVQTWDECIRIGNLLADEAMRIVKDAPVQENPDLWVGAKEVKFHVDSDLLWAVVEGSPLGYPTNDDRTVTTLMNLINVGNAQILTIPGEALPNIGFYLKRHMNGEGDNNFLFGLTNDAFGYILTKEDFNSFKRYDYVSETSLGERTGTTLIEEGLKFVSEAPKPKPVG